MDALTTILESIALRSAVFCRAELSAPWSVRTEGMDAGIFHAVVRGRAWAIPDSDRMPRPLATGDVVVFPHGGGHVMADDPSTRSRPIRELVEDAEDGVGCLSIAGGGAATSLLCGRIDFARGGVHPLLGVLPPVIVIQSEQPAVHGWMGATIQLMAAELAEGAPGSETVIARLADVIVIQALRTVAANADAGAHGWLGGMQDPGISRSLALLHRNPEQRWTVGSLARSVGMSRSGFSARFAALVGEPPLKYLTRWRMHVAARLLRDERASVAEAATGVGYTSVASFSKAFRELVGSPPGTYRRSTLRPAG